MNYQAVQQRAEVKARVSAAIEESLFEKRRANGIREIKRVAGPHLNGERDLSENPFTDEELAAAAETMIEKKFAMLLEDKENVLLALDSLRGHPPSFRERVRRWLWLLGPF